MIRNNFNIIGVGLDWDRAREPGNTETYRYCSIHPYKKLIESKTDNTVLFCPQCGSEWKKEDTVKEQDIQTDIPVNSGPKIIQGKKKRKFYDSKGNLITDETLIQDLLQGKNIIYYNETKSGKESSHIVHK
jgi:hypothetical protein